MNAKTENCEERICRIRQRIKDQFYFTSEVVTRIAEEVLKDMNWKQ